MKFPQLIALTKVAFFKKKMFSLYVIIFFNFFKKKKQFFHSIQYHIFGEFQETTIPHKNPFGGSFPLSVKINPRVFLSTFTALKKISFVALEGTF